MQSANYYAQALSNPYAKAFLDTIAWAEGANYNTLFGGGTFSSYAQHPNRAISAGSYTSTAAGRYQFLYSTWRGIANSLGLSDFSPTNQDIAALALIDQRGELGDLLNGDLNSVLQGLGCAWASLPYSGCGQGQKSLSSVTNYFNSAVSALGGEAVNVNYSVNQVLNGDTSTDNTDSSTTDFAFYAAAGLLVLFLVKRQY